MLKNRLTAGVIALFAFFFLLAGCSQGTGTISATSPATAPSTAATVPASTTISKSAVFSTNSSTIQTTKTTLTTTQTVPIQYLSLYNQLQGYVSADDKLVSTQWNGTTYPVNCAAELLTADTNTGPGILTSNERQMMTAELDGEVALGVKAITVEIGFPVFDHNSYIYDGQSAAQAQQTVQTWLDYYTTLAQAIHSRGLKMIVEANPLLSFYISSASSFNPTAYYKSLDFATYEKLRSEHNVILAQQIKPDYLLLQTEPQTDAVNDFRPELNNAAKDIAMISKFVTDIQGAGIKGLHSLIQIGSGAGTWQPDWKAFFTGLDDIAGLDKIDTHIYNLQPNVNQIGEVPIAMQIADMAHAAGKGVTMSEFWFHKSNILVGLTEGGDPLIDIRVRDMFSFWEPLDAQALQLLAKLANDKHFDYVSAFGHYHWFALIDYNLIHSQPVYPAANSTQNEVIDNQITTLQNQSARQALNDNQLSPTGKAYQTIITNQSIP